MTRKQKRNRYKRILRGFQRPYRPIRRIRRRRMR